MKIALQQIPEETIHTSFGIIFGRAEFDWNLMSAMVPKAKVKHLRQIHQIYDQKTRRFRDFLLNLYALMRSTPIQLFQL